MHPDFKISANFYNCIPPIYNKHNSTENIICVEKTHIEKNIKYMKLILFSSAIISDITAATSYSELIIGKGNILTFIAIGSALTVAAFFLAGFLDTIPVIGRVLRMFTGITVALWWILLVTACIINYGFVAFSISAVAIAAISYFFGGIKKFVMLFFK